MSVYEFQAPIYGLACEHPAGCGKRFRPVSRWNQGDDRGIRARTEAREAGWQVRPYDGRGSRTAPDLCPKHRTDGVSS